MFQHYDEDGNFIIESGSNAVPVFKVSGSQVVVSGSLLPGDPESSASAELGNEDHPWKELYVESASIWFVDTKLDKSDARRKTRFSKKDIEDLKDGKSLNDDGNISASGDMHVVGTSTFRGRSNFDGVTSLRGETQVTGALLVEGAADFKGHFRVNGNRIQEGELRTLAGLTATTDELNIMDGVTATTAELNKIDGFTGVVADLNYAKDLRATGVTATEFDYLDGVTSNIQTQIDNAGGGGGGSGNYDTGSDLLPHADGTYDLGSTSKEWQDLHLDGVGYIDTAIITAERVTGEFYSEGVHTLGGAGSVNVSSIPSNGLIDARAANLFYMGVDGTINGIRGTRTNGQVVTFIQPNNRRNDFTHQSTNVNIHSTEKFVFPLSRNVSGRGPQAIRFIYDGTLRCWYRLI